MTNTRFFFIILSFPSRKQTDEYYGLRDYSACVDLRSLQQTVENALAFCGSNQGEGGSSNGVHSSILTDQLKS
jgi:hypothetical protein